MRLTYANLSGFPQLLGVLAGLTVTEFDELAEAVRPHYVEAEQRRLSRPGRRRALGAGRSFALAFCDQLLLTAIWFHCHPTDEALGRLFGVSDSTVSRIIQRAEPLLQQLGRNTMQRPDPGRGRRRQLNELLRDLPELSAVMEASEPSSLAR